MPTVEFTVRIPSDLHEDLQAVSLAESRSMAEIVRVCIASYTQSNPALDEIKELVAAVRSAGPVSRDDALEAARRIADSDTSGEFGRVDVS